MATILFIYQFTNKVVNNMSTRKFNRNLSISILILVLLIIKINMYGQTAWFADGYHGGVYGHYPDWQAKFMYENLKKNPDWNINLEIEPETWDTVSLNDEDNFRTFQDFFEKEGRFGRIEFVNPTYGQPFCYNISGESIIRHFYFGIDKILEYFPKASFTSYSSEEPCFTSSLPQILKGFGYKYAVLKNPNTCWGGYTTNFGKDLVNWIGPDGTTLITVPRYGCEDLSNESTWQTNSWTNSNEFIKLCFENGIKYPVGMCFQDAGWDGGPWFNEYQPSNYIAWTDYFELVKNKVNPQDWHFSQEDIKPGLVWGAQVLQEVAKDVRESENNLILAEKITTFDCLLNRKEWPKKLLNEAWRNLLLSQHHDCWIIPFYGADGISWADKAKNWTNSTDSIAKISIDSFLKGEGKNQNSIKVCNTLGSHRTENVTVLLNDFDPNFDYSVYNCEGEEVSTQLGKNSQGEMELHFIAKVPPMGYTTFSLNRNKHRLSSYPISKRIDKPIVINTDYYSVTINPRKGGTITRLFDKQNQRELVDDNKELNNLVGYFYNEDRFIKGSDRPAKVDVHEGEIFTKIRIENKLGGNDYLQWITFYKNNHLIDFELEIIWNTQPGIGAYDQNDNYNAKDRNKAFYNEHYKLHVQFPFKKLGKKIFKNAPFDVCESQLNNTLFSSWDSLKHNVILNWVDVENSDMNYGVALFSDHTTSYLNTKELPLGLTVQYAGKGLWGHYYDVKGVTNIRYAVLPHMNNWENACVEFISNAWNERLVGGFIDSIPKEKSYSLFENSDKNLHVTSLFLEDKDMIVRVYNTSSNKIKKEIKWNLKVDSIDSVNLDGSFLSKLEYKINDKEQIILPISIPQFGFQTIKLKNARTR